MRGFHIVHSRMQNNQIVSIFGRDRVCTALHNLVVVAGPPMIGIFMNTDVDTTHANIREYFDDASQRLKRDYTYTAALRRARSAEGYCEIN